MTSKSQKNTCDKYQERYVAHQARKKEQLTPKNVFKPVDYSKTEKGAFEKVLAGRHSQRVFSGAATQAEIDYLLTKMLQVPNSCNRMGVVEKVVEARDDKALLTGILVGGVGWCHRASHLVLLFADMKAYKSPAERSNMPYLDAGVKIMAGYLAAEIQGLGCCYINPNIREENKNIFEERFGGKDLLFCGTLAIG